MFRRIEHRAPRKKRARAANFNAGLLLSRELFLRHLHVRDVSYSSRFIDACLFACSEYRFEMNPYKYKQPKSNFDSCKDLDG